MIFFLNYDGTLTRQDTGRIYQGSTAVPEIKVLSGVSSPSSVLKVAFTLPNGLTTEYFPLTQLGEYEQDGVKAYLWSLELATDILANVTEQVGEVGVSVQQVNVINNTVVASSTATFNVEYSALPYTPTEYTPADTEALINLLSAYYNQNQTIINSISGDYTEVIARLETAEGNIETLGEDVEHLEDLTDQPLIVDITTDLTNGTCTKIYNNGTSVTFSISTDITVVNRNDFVTIVSFLASDWVLDDDGTYSIAFSSATTNRSNSNCVVDVDKVDADGYKKTANAVVKGTDGSLLLYGATTPYAGRLVVVGGSGAGTTIWQGTTPDGYASIANAVNGDLYLNTNGGQLFSFNNGTWSFVFLMKSDLPTREANTNNNCYVLTPQGTSTIPAYEKVTLTTTDNLNYTLAIGGKIVGGFSLANEIYLDSVTLDGETLVFTYNTASGKEAIEVPLGNITGANNLLVATTEADFNSLVIVANIGKVISYEGELYIVIASGDTATTTSVAQNDYDYLTDKPILNANLIGTSNPVAGTYYRHVGSTNDTYTRGVIYYYDGTSYNALGTGGGGNVTNFQIGDGITELGIDPDGRGIDVKYNDAEVEYDNGESYNNFPVEITMPIVAGENVTFETDETGKAVKIGVPSADGELVDNLAYSDLVDVPILIADLDTITPTANTYYKHNGADETTYTKGVIYFYDGTAFKAITGGGGGTTLNKYTANCSGMAGLELAYKIFNNAKSVVSCTDNYFGLNWLTGFIKNGYKHLSSAFSLNHSSGALSFGVIEWQTINSTPTFKVKRIANDQTISDASTSGVSISLFSLTVKYFNDVEITA